MAPQPPLLLIENILDTIVGFPGGALASSSELVGREGFRVADYRRERSWWQPTGAGERAHVDMTANTVGGTDQRVLTSTTATPFASGSGTSHTFAFLVRSTASLATGHVLLHTTGGTVLSLWRSNGGLLSFNNNGTQRDFAGSAAPTTDAWHTIMFVLDGATPTAKAYVDAVQSGSAATYTPQAINANNALVIGASTAFTLALSGKLGRFAYWNSDQTANLAAIHAALINEDRSGTNIITGSTSTALHAWDPVFGQATQQLGDRRGTTHLNIGRTSSVESSPSYDPPWGGGHWVGVQLPTGISLAPDYLWIDRGHNLWNQFVAIDGDVNNTTFASVYSDRSVAARQVPALDVNGNYVVGGDPTTGFCVTEEGALFALFTAPGIASPALRVRVVGDLITPVVPGIMLGRRHQLLNFSTTFDEDAGGRKVASEESDSGYLGQGKAYSWRTVDIGLKYIGAAEYDSTIRALRQLLFERNQPTVVCMDYGTCPQRAWLYQLDARAWTNPKQRVYRDGRLSLREVGPRLI